ncbi:flavin-containing monooxygenase [Nocardia altamirensis]|uniref:flavin-containing monooxygenase n=1 Tax=Nocardia altamirensis TaxID=472158 RepID=UPI000840540D|nr:NAD(P)/FAD-dependent oxidoreductase [Nocardia altamirensis]
MASAIHTRVLIVGSGFSGLGMGIALDADGIDDYLIVEKADEVGGTWRDNTYPGCACDVPTLLYSYSYETRTDWRRLFSGQQEILDYVRDIADKYRLRSRIRFGQRIDRGYWDDAERRWHVHSADGQEYIAQFLVSAVGALHIPNIPDFRGIADFTGATFHSAEWDHQVELTGKRVAVIGTGASAVQFVPEIVGDVAQLLVFQRTPPWVLPRADVEFSPRFKRALRRIPGLRFVLRNALYWGAEVGGFAMNWRPDLLKVLERMGRSQIERQIADPVLRAQVTPDYRAGCKRLLGSDTYYPALADPKTELVTAHIDRITPHGIVTADGVEHAVDVIIYGTGFRVIDSYQNLAIVGRGGVDLAAQWARDGVQAHRGVTVADMPNAFFLLGPNTGLGHNSIIFMIEAQIHYVRQAIRQLKAQGAVALAPRRAAQDRFNAKLQHGLARSVWNTGGCQSWYLDEHGNNRTMWSGFTWQYWLQTRRLNPAEYEFFGPAPSSATRRPPVAKDFPAQTFPTAKSNGKPTPATQ